MGLYAQQSKCATMSHWDRIKAQDSHAETRMQEVERFTQNWIQENGDLKMTRNIIQIPVVVHVLYHADIENISAEQIYSQINILNEDFRLLNTDSLQPNHPFWPYTADVEIEFCMAQKDPDGNPSNGITRTYTDSVGYAAIGYEKFTEAGGKDNWNPSQYLNIWVCNLDASGGTLGYAAFPSDLEASPSLDGVVIRYEAFGNIGTAGMGAFVSNNLGRTATHEVGHWLNLRHIWGDEECGDDLVTDTEPAVGDNYQCPTFPHNANNTCGSGEYGEMYMNYMDYVDDACMVMFTFGQKSRMLAALSGPRSGLLSSNGCDAASGLNSQDFQGSFEVYPNPSTGVFMVEVNPDKKEDISISVSNAIGEVIYQSNHQNISSSLQLKLNLINEAKGIYFVQIKTDHSSVVKKMLINE